MDIDGVPVMKESSGKHTYPGRKQIFRSAAGDRLGLAEEATSADSGGLLNPIMRNGVRLVPDDPLETIRERASQSVAQLPLSVRDVYQPVVPQAEISTALRDLTNCTRRSHLATVN